MESQLKSLCAKISKPKFFEQMMKIGGGYSFGETRMAKFEMGDFVPRHMFDTHRSGESYWPRHLNRRGDPHLREIIFCDPVTDETFYITDTPVLASDFSHKVKIYE